MSTTPLLVEIVIIGVQSALWLLLAGMTLFGLPSVDTEKMRGWETLLSVAVLALSYAIGVAFDRLADRILSAVRIRIVGPARELESRIPLLAQNSAYADILNYSRHRIRILRSSVLNFFLITMFASLLIWLRLPDLRNVVWLVFSSGTILTVLVGWGWLHLEQKYESIVTKAVAAPGGTGLTSSKP